MTTSTSELLYDLISREESEDDISHLKPGSLVGHRAHSGSLGFLVQYVKSPASGLPLIAEVLWSIPPQREILRIDSSGNLGIGSVSPKSRLSIS